MTSFYSFSKLLKRIKDFHIHWVLKKINLDFKNRIKALVTKIHQLT